MLIIQSWLQNIDSGHRCFNYKEEASFYKPLSPRTASHSKDEAPSATDKIKLSNFPGIKNAFFKQARKKKSSNLRILLSQARDALLASEVILSTSVNNLNDSCECYDYISSQGPLNPSKRQARSITMQNPRTESLYSEVTGKCASPGNEEGV